MPLQQHLEAPNPKSDEGRKLEALLVSLTSSLVRKFHDYSSARQDKDREWEKAIRQYEGLWDHDDLAKVEQALSMRGLNSDPVSVNITRPKADISIARMKDLQFPTGGDYNFFLTPAPLTTAQKEAAALPKPDGSMQMAAAAEGAPADTLPAPQDMVAEMQKENEDRTPAMERALRNRMIYADYGKKARLAIEDLCIKGTAIIKGPVLRNRKHRMYEEAQASDGTPVQLHTEVFVPEATVERVDPLYFFPDPSARLPDESEDSFELHPMTATELIELSKNPAFMKEQISKALMLKPDVSDIPDVVNRSYRELSNNVHNRYWLHEYRGALDKNVLFEGGMISEKDKDDPLKQYIGEVWYVNKTIVRVSLSPLDGDEGLPYGISVWKKDPNSVFGHGVPYLLRNPQRVVNNAYLMLLDNASLTAGPQIVLNKEMIEPATRDEDYGVEPMKAWFLTEYGADVNQAMQFIHIPAQMDGIAQIIDTAMQFADVESATPLMLQGEVPSGNNTTTGLAMIMSASNIVQKDASMSWDDYITKPLVERFYHYEMQYGEDPSVKGDYEINVGGATERVEAEIRAQEIEKMLGLASSNEEFMMHIDPAKAFRALVDNTRTGDLLRSDEEVAQMQQQAEEAAQQQQNPEDIKAQAALITAQARMQEAQANAQLNNAKQEMAAMEMQSKYQSYIAEAQARQNEAALNYQIELAKLASEKEVSVVELQKELQLKNMEHQMQLELKEIDFAKMEREIQVKHEFGTGI
jgi:hypothetical protein